MSTCALALLVGGALIATVQARPGGEQRALLRAQHAAARQQRASARRESRQPRGSRSRLPAETQVAPSRGGHGKGPEREHAVVLSTCQVITWSYRKFPSLAGNAVREKISVAHYAPVFQEMKFDGEGHVQTTAIGLPPGRHERLDTKAHWRTNGVRGGFDIVSKKECPPAPAFAIEKRQQIAGSGEGFTTAPLKGLSGQTVNYQITVQNTGNVPLVLSNFIDEHCDSGTIAGGQGETPLQPGAMPSLGGKTTYTCTHVLTSLNTYENDGTITATPPSGDGAPITHTSNTVVVTLTQSAPAFSIEKLQKIEGSSGSFTSSPLSGEVGQTVDYEIVVKNTGNTSLTFSNFTDEHCDGGTIAGGPSGPLAPTESATYTCKHMLTSADQTAGSYSNSATDTATPPGEPAITHTSNTVVVTLTPPPPEPTIYVGYGDGAANNHGGSNGFPTPWNGSPNVTFVGCGFGGSDTCPKSGGVDVYDAGAIRIDAPSGGPTLTVTGATAVIGPCTYEPWPSLSVSVAPGHTLILTQTGMHQCTAGSGSEQDNFDTSESFLKSPQYQQFVKTGKCASDGYVPAVTLTINSHTVTLSDSTRVLNTGGTDPDICSNTTETQNWVALALPAGQHFARATHAAPMCRARRGTRRRGHAGSSRCTRSAHTHASATVPVKLV
ncbi:MAG TPA: hypothetical protein VGX51_06475 [Solirubrobacteraceae bacterium]|jgi:hypothetical protein|nr:hypothetical protein [Solirubrobacteraceae bacterium]